MNHGWVWQSWFHGHRIFATLQAYSDPQKMRELMERSNAARREKEARLARMVGSSRDDFSSTSGGFGGSNTVRPHNYKKERAAAERAET